MPSTRQPQRTCQTCGCQWYPRRHHISPKCPQCRGTKIRKTGGGLVVLTGLFVLWGLFHGEHGKSGGDAQDRPSATATAIKTATAMNAAQVQSSIVNSVYATATLKLRSDPTSESEQVATIKRGTRLTAVARIRSWIKVRSPEGVTGFVYARLVSSEPQ